METETGAGVEAIAPEVLRGLYERMYLIRTVNDEVVEEVKRGRLKAAAYPVHGLEAVCASMGAATRADDQLVSTYRNMGDTLAKGSDVERVIAEIYGRANGVSKGKGGAMHLHDVNVGFVTSTGIVGAGLPIAVGLALAAKLDGSDRISITTFGDGSTSIGAFHEAMNLAALWKLPIVFICQNNQWGEHTPLAGYMANTDIAGKAKGYGVRTFVTDGFDAVQTYQTLVEAVGVARSGGGPVFVEAQTYRLSPHSAASDMSYVPREEFAAAMERDPVPGFRRWLIESGSVDEQEVVRLESEISNRVARAFEDARSGQAPAASEKFTDVFADESVVRAL